MVSYVETFLLLYSGIGMEMIQTWHQSDIIGRFICATEEEEPNEIEMLSHQTIEIGLVHQPDSHLLDNNEGERDLIPQKPLQKVLDVASAICIQLKGRLVCGFELMKS